MKNFQNKIDGRNLENKKEIQEKIMEKSERGNIYNNLTFNKPVIEVAFSISLYSVYFGAPIQKRIRRK